MYFYGMKTITFNETVALPFFRKSIKYAAQAGWGLDLIRQAFIKCGCDKSINGSPLSNSHISNFLRKKLNVRMVKAYVKKNYKGKNWRSFV